MKLLKKLFVLTLALVAFFAASQFTYAVPPCGYYDENNVWHRYTEGGYDSFSCWWERAYYSGEVTLSQYQSMCHITYPSQTAKCQNPPQD